VTQGTVSLAGWDGGAIICRHVPTRGAIATYKEWSGQSPGTDHCPALSKRKAKTGWKSIGDGRKAEDE
jgi:hypothetical protein